VNKILQAIVGILMVPILFALTTAAFSEIGDVLGGSTSSLGLNYWIPIGTAAYAIGFVFLEKTSLGGLFRWEGIESLWRKAIGKRAGFSPEDSGKELPPQPPKPMRVVPYCIPIYALAGIIVIGLVHWGWPHMDHYAEIFGFVTGFFYTHHIAWIGKDIRNEHPDIRVAGNVLTPAIVYMVNIQLMLFVLAIMVPRAHWWIHVNHEAFLYASRMLEDMWYWVKDTI